MGLATGESASFLVRETGGNGAPLTYLLLGTRTWGKHPVDTAQGTQLNLFLDYYSTIYNLIGLLS